VETVHRIMRFESELPCNRWSVSQSVRQSVLALSPSGTHRWS